MDLTKFEYPMFSTTDREKEILRMCEIELIHLTYWTGICYLLFRLYNKNRIRWIEYLILKERITVSILPNAYLEEGIELPQPAHRYRVLMRRIWITKLINYKGD